MKKTFIVLVLLATMTACEKSEFNELCEKVSKSNEEKKDTNFLIFNDHYKKGKSEGD